MFPCILICVISLCDPMWRVVLSDGWLGIAAFPGGELPFQWGCPLLRVVVVQGLAGAGSVAGGGGAVPSGSGLFGQSFRVHAAGSAVGPLGRWLQSFQGGGLPFQ